VQYNRTPYCAAPLSPRLISLTIKGLGKAAIVFYKLGAHSLSGILVLAIAASANAQVSIDLAHFPNGTVVPPNQVISNQWQSEGILFSARAAAEPVGAQGSVWPFVAASGGTCNRYYFFWPDVFGAVGIFRFVQPGTNTPIDVTHFEMRAGWEFGETVILDGYDQNGVKTATQTYNAPCGGFCSGLVSLTGLFHTVEVRTFGNPGIGFYICAPDGTPALKFTP
jgi:hypothetical protein